MNPCRRIFYLFIEYWKLVEKRGREHSGLQVFVATSHICGFLRKEWEKMVGILNS